MSLLNKKKKGKTMPREKKVKKLEDRIVRYLTEFIGCEEVKSRSHYRHFRVVNQKTGEWTNYFVGKKGAVRIGKNASNSFSVTALVVRNTEKWEKDMCKERRI